jgi:signal transduction histidine kinase
VRSVLGQGSTFTISLPMADGASPSPTPGPG